MMDSKSQNALQLYDADEARLVSDLRDDKRDGVDRLKRCCIERKLLTKKKGKKFQTEDCSVQF